MISIPVIFSLRATHGAHTVNFAPWDKGDSGDYINKTTQVAYKIMKSNIYGFNYITKLIIT